MEGDAIAEGADRGRLLVIGNLDGVHRGHQAVLRDAAVDARALGLELMVQTFEPHPAKVLRGAGPPMLTTLPRKIELIKRVAPEASVAVETFDHAWAAQSPEEFAERILALKYRARVVEVGQNFRFGKDRAGDFAALVALGARLGFEARSHAIEGDEAGPWSSSRARDAIARGDIEEAARVLGRPPMLSGVVVKGDQRGRKIGFPTCNLGSVEQALPAFGVYAALVDKVSSIAEGGAARGARAFARGVMNIGVRPTVKSGEAQPSVEVHLFDVDADLYSAELRVHLISRVREERRFSGLAELKEQIAKDAAYARSRLAEERPDPAAEGAWS